MIPSGCEAHLCCSREQKREIDLKDGAYVAEVSGERGWWRVARVIQGDETLAHNPVSTITLISWAVL